MTRDPKEESLLSAIAELEVVVDRIHNILNLSQDETTAEDIAEPILAARDRVLHQKRLLVAIADSIEKKKEELHNSFGEALL